MLKLENVSFSYADSDEGAGLRNISTTIPQGQVVLLCGESGCGKTTLTRLINGLIPHFFEGSLTGKVTVCGKDVASSQLYELSPLIGSVFQNPKSQFYTVDTDSEIVFGCENIGMPKEQIQKNLDETINNLNLYRLLNRSLFELSGGEKQKIACASVSALHPKIFVMDEPSSNLDYKGIRELMNVIAGWKRDGCTVIIAEHRLEWLKTLADRVIYMSDGQIGSDMSMGEFKGKTEEELHVMGLRTEPHLSPVSKSWENNEDKFFFRNITFSYKKSRDRKALDINMLKLPVGSVVGIVGENGAGKSTFAGCLCGLEKHMGGNILYKGNNLMSKDRIKLCYMVMQNVNYQLFTESVVDELMLSMEKSKFDETEKRVKAEEILKKLDLLGYKDRHPMSLSGGQKQRVSIACALASDKEILVYDEPTSGLDYHHMIDFAALIKDMQQIGKTQLIITHDPEIIGQCCDNLMFFENGKVLWHKATDADAVAMMQNFFAL